MRTSPSNIRSSHLVLLVLTFCATRVLAFWAGLRYLTGETPALWHLLDLDLLHYHLFRSLLHLHAQPPLYNALFGLAEKIAGPHYGQLLLTVQLSLGLCMGICVYLSLAFLRVHPTACLLAALMLLLNPTEIAFEFDPLYTELVVSLHCFIALALVIAARRHSLKAVYALIALAVLLTLIRSSYQWVWLMAIFSTLWWQLPEKRTQIRNAGLVGLFVSLIYPAKNYVLFHHFTTTTWGPFSMAKHWEAERNHPPLDAWLRTGRVQSFLPLPDESQEQLQARLRAQWREPPTGWPELDDVSKSIGGGTNWNSLAMMRMLDAKGKDVVFLLRHDPRDYAINVARGLVLYFQPASDYIPFLGGESALQYERIRPIDSAINRFCCNIFGLPPNITKTPGNIAHPRTPPTIKILIKRLCMGALLANGLVLACLISFRLPSFWETFPDRKAAAMVMIVTIAYVFLVVSLVETGENERFRFETHALVLMVAVVFLQQVCDRWALRKRRVD